MEPTFKSISVLNFGPNDAQDYNSGTDPGLLERLFLMDDNLQSLCRNRSIYFLIGEKGAGKTAYATYVSKFGAHGAHGLDLFMSPQDYLNVAKAAKSLGVDAQDLHLIWEAILLLFLTSGCAKQPGALEAEPAII
ncbi:MAG: hypothetical protein ACREF4_02350, partial [Gammaproteobacteria bacterium]